MSMARLGFTCRYTPLPLLAAAGFTPYRVLPVGDPPEKAGAILHDNLCPHVKRILDRAVADDLPELRGLVVMNSCDAMRRLADAWVCVRPDDRVCVVDLPVTSDERAVARFHDELERLRSTLAKWSGCDLDDAAISRATELYRRAAESLGELANAAADGRLSGSRATLQRAVERTVTQQIDDAVEYIDDLLSSLGPPTANSDDVPVFLFGNVLPDPGAFDLIADCGARVVDDDLCTGSRQIVPFEIKDGEPVLRQMARQLLAAPRCARSMAAEMPGGLGAVIADRVRAAGARGAIAYVVKFCDPYLIRLPAIHDALRAAGIPLLVLEGDCTLRSLGQQRTRLEAFVEMIAGGD